MRHCLPIFIATLMLTVCVAANAASILVNTADDELNDDGDCSLREAVEAANTNTVVDDCNPGDAGADTITILVDGTIALSSVLEIAEPVTIQGLGMNTTVISGSNADRIFDIDVPTADAEVLIQHIQMKNGYTASPTGGGAIIARCAGTLRLEDVEMRNNSAVGDGDVNGPGGALHFRPKAGCAGSRLEIASSRFVGNESAMSFGGAIYALNDRNAQAPLDAVVIESSLFLQNTALDGGAVASINVPVLSIQDSLFEANQVDTVTTQGNRHGGALYVSESTLLSSTTLALIERTSFLFNFSGEGGGAAHFRGPLVALIRNSLAFNNNIAQPSGGRAFNVDGDGSLGIWFSTLFNNGSGVDGDVALRAGVGSNITLNHTIVANDWTTSANCDTYDDGTITSNGFTIDSGDTCTSHATDLPNTDPMLPGLSAHSILNAPFDQAVLVPLDDSPAIDGGASGNCPGPFQGQTTVDQRNRTRPVSAPTRGSDPICDIGAIEFQADDSRIIFRDRFEKP